jgi:TolB protein
MSPNGKWIVFGSNRDSASEGGGDIYMMKAAENETAMRITDGGDNYNPVWAPDGRKFAFTSQRDGHSSIYVMDPDATHQRRVTRGPPSVRPAGLGGGCRTS